MTGTIEMTEKQTMLDTAPQTAPKASAKSKHQPARYDDAEIARARGGSTPEALTIIDPYAAPVRLRRLSDGFDVL